MNIQCLSSILYQINFSVLALPPKPELYAVNAEYSKQADYAISTTLVLASKNQITSTKLNELLIENKVPQLTVNQLTELYEKHKDDIIFKLSRFGTSHNLPELTNVNWELTCDVADSADLNYKINLQSFNHAVGNHDKISEFFCNPEELQSLLYQLKEIERHCEKIGQGK